MVKPGSGNRPCYRYLLITEKFPPRKGGSNIWFNEVYRRIGDKRTHIVTCDQPGAEAFDAVHPNTVHRLSLRRHWWLRPESLAIYVKLLAKSLPLAWRDRFDAIHAGRVLSEGLIGLILARLLRLPLVIYAHGEEITTWRQPLKLKAMTFTYRKADGVIANSRFTQQELLKLGVEPAKIRLIFPGVDVEAFRPGLGHADLRESIHLRPEQRLILSIGRLFRRKGFDQVVRALPHLIQRGMDVHYVIIGIGEDRDYLTRLAKELDVDDRVHLLGHVSAEDLPRWYNACDVFAMPNREVNHDTEGFGLVFLEAAASAKPALAGLAGGTGDAVLDGITGLRVDGSSLEAVTAALMKILNDPAYARRLGENGYRRVKAEFSWDAIADQTIHLSHRLIAQIPPPGKLNDA